MNKFFDKIKLLAIILAVVCLNSSCDNFLDRQEDEKLTFDKIWQSGPETRKYWYNAMSFINSEVATFIGDANPFLGASDEASISYSKDYNAMNFGTWNAAAIPYTGKETFDYYYKGIRECNIFLANIGRLSDPQVEQDEIDRMIVQTRFARAYYYFCMMRLYGPVFLVGDEILDVTGTTESLARPRNTWDECVKYVTDELTELANDSRMISTWTGDSEKGLATKGACNAIVARLKLYSARPLFNGNPMYSSVLNPVTDKFPNLSGVNLFPVNYEPKKWLEAAQAALTVIDDPQYKLYRAGNNNPYEDYYGITQTHWNSELIWSTGYKNRYYISVNTAPTGLAGTSYGGIGPTQQQVDAYAMKNGIYPITGYRNNGTEPIIDSRSNYSVNELDKSTWIYPAWAGKVAYQISAPNMYKDREPRFYVNVFFSGSYWTHGTAATNRTLISFAKGGNSNTTHDYPKSGYLINRFYDHTANSTAGTWGNIVFPTIRLAEVYLNFIESVLMCKKNGVSMPSSYETRAMSYWDDIRDRAGVPSITQAYPGASIDQLIELCRSERRVELSFENHRFFDTRTWMIAEQTDNGPMYGMDSTYPVGTNKNDTPDGFWKRTVFETRVFKPNFYLYPWSQRELERNRLLTQNYGW